MAYRIQQGFALVAFVVLASACSGQQNQSFDVQFAQNEESRTTNQDCTDSACGTMNSAATRTIEEQESAQNQQIQNRQLMSNECPTAMCEPMSRATAWRIEEQPKSNECPNTGCEAPTRASTPKGQYTNTAQNRQRQGTSLK
jgi:hypothetical protein